MSKTRSVRLSAWLILLVLGAVVPLLLFAGTTLRGIFTTSRSLADRGQADTTQALTLAVDGEVRAWRAALLTLASSLSLQRGRWVEFYDEARELAARYEGWVVLNPATGPQRLNTLRAVDAPLPQTAASDMVQAVFRDGKPVTDMAFGAVAQRYVISNSVPVFRDGKVVFCLSLNFGPERLTRLLQSQRFPPTWVAAVSDSQRRLIARSRDADARLGKPTVEWFAAATQAAEAGMVTGPLMDGWLAQVAFRRAQEAPWVVALAIPVAELQSAAPIWSFLSVGVILGLVAVGMAVYMGRKVVVPVRNLAQISERSLRGEVRGLGPPTRIREVQELQQALRDASAAARAHLEERERNAEALREANHALEARVLERTAALADANDALRAANAALQEEMAQRRRAEEEVLTLARFPAENPNPVLRLNSDGRILFANAASAALLHQWGSVVGGQAPAPWPDAVRRALASHAGVTVELACGSRTYAASLVPVPEAAYVNLYTVDVADRKQAEEALRQLNAELEQRVAARTGDLAQAAQTLERQTRQLRALTAELALAEQRERRRLADVLHDGLQQLLVATRLRAHMLGRAEDAQVRQGSQEIVALVEEALAATRSLTGELSPPSLQKGGLLPALEWLTRWMQERHKFTVRLQPSPAPLPALREDLNALVYQSVRELLLNAVKYARVEAADVMVTHDAADLTLTVTDAGVGFDPTSLRVAGGTEGGFGLLGIRERLESVGGRLEIASTPGEGSRFTLTLPLLVVLEEGLVPTPPAPSRGEAEKGSPVVRRLRVLVVDDHALARRGFATLLAKEPDLTVVGEAANGQMAIELTRELAPDVILMDISMPVLDGIEATRAIHAEFPVVRVIGLSLFDVTEQPEAMRQAGAVGYLSKSDSAEALLAAIRGGGESER